jgi:hypothetical protein
MGSVSRCGLEDRFFAGSQALHAIVSSQWASCLQARITTVSQAAFQSSITSSTLQRCGAASGKAGKPGRPAAIWVRARAATWRQAASFAPERACHFGEFEAEHVMQRKPAHSSGWRRSISSSKATQII